MVALALGGQKGRGVKMTHIYKKKEGRKLVLFQAEEKVKMRWTAGGMLRGVMMAAVLM